MELIRVTERIWIYPFEKKRDRPNLVYIRGDRWSLVVDAGHSADHVQSFYQALYKAGLPLPSLTVLTHWHWDHTLGLHAVHELTLASKRTNQYLADFRKRLEAEGTGFFFALDSCIRAEYDDGQPVIVTLADLTYAEEMLLDAGNCPIRVFEAPSPHTDDSTLVEVPGERVLILGDSTSGRFPEWTVDAALAERMAETIREVDPEICIHGHRLPVPTQELIQDLLAAAGGD